MLKQLLLAISFLFVATFAKSQDTIVKIDQTIIIAKVLEISPKQIKYKKFTYQEGPTYIIPTHLVDKIIYPNGFEETYRATEAMQTVRNTPKTNTYNKKTKPVRSFERASRKGVHVGLFTAIAAGRILKKPDSPTYSNANYSAQITQSSKLSNALGIEVKVYTNRYLGIKTGLIFQSYKYNEEAKLTDHYSSYYETHSFDYHVNNFGFPLFLSFTSIGTIAFTVDLGIFVGMPYKANADYTINSSSGYSSTDHADFKEELSNVIIHEAAQIGLLFELNQRTNFALGFYQTYSLMSYIEEEKIKARMYGAYFSLSFKFD